MHSVIPDFWKWLQVPVLSGILAGPLAAAPTHQLVQEFSAMAGGQDVTLPVGAQVEVASMDGRAAMVRHTLPGGSSTLLFIPVGHLKGIPAPSPPGQAENSAVPSPSQALAAPTPVAAPTPSARLGTKEGRTVIGRILRIEKHHVVMVNEEGQVEDLPLKSLDESSQDVLVRWKFQAGNKRPEPDPRVVPGAKIILEFPELGPSRTSDPARVQIRIPEDYTPDRPVPLALYLGGGQGTDNGDALKNFVDPGQWVTVAFPYPKAVNTPLHAYKEGKSGDLIEFQKPMLERLQALVPNADPDRRVVVGSSNGAHMIAIASCDGWKEFAEYFNAFVLHEGGGSASRNFSALRRKEVYILMGENSESLNFSKGVVAAAERSRLKPDVFVAPGEGHGMGAASRQAIKEWIAKWQEK